MKSENQSDLSRKVGEKEARKLKARRRKQQGIWFGFSMFGLVGWSVIIPTLLGAMLGMWIDKRYPGPHSWTLALLVVGLSLGSLNAWNWVEKESRALDEDDGTDEDPQSEKI